MFARFTERARKILSLARQEAIRCRHDYVGTEHILLGLVAEGSGVAAVVLKKMSIELAAIRAQVEDSVEPGPKPVSQAQQLPYTPGAKKVFELALEEAGALGHHYVGTEHLLLGLVREREGAAAQALRGLGLELDALRQQVTTFLKEGAAEGEAGPAVVKLAAAPEPPRPPAAEEPAPAEAPRPAAKWEYKVIESKHVPGGGLSKGKGQEALEAQLNALGEQGWEIIDIEIVEGDGRQAFVVVAKRRKP